MEFFFVITLQCFLPGQSRTWTTSGTVTVKDGATNEELFETIYRKSTEGHVEIPKGTPIATLFYSVLPQQITC